MLYNHFFKICIVSLVSEEIVVIVGVFRTEDDGVGFECATVDCIADE